MQRPKDTTWGDKTQEFLKAFYTLADQDEDMWGERAKSFGRSMNDRLSKDLELIRQGTVTEQNSVGILVTSFKLEQVYERKIANRRAWGQKKAIL